MAKKSMVNREVKRAKLVKQHATKRAALKVVINDQSKPVEERFKATLKLASLPRNSSATRLHNRCQLTGRPHAFYRKLKLSRIMLRELASFGQIPGMVVSTPASKLRAWVLEVLASEGYIRGFERTKTDNGQGELVISLKYFEGTPVIREVKRVSKPGRRVYMSVKEIPTVRNGLGISIVSTPKGVMSDANARAANVGGEVLCTVF